MKLPSINCWIAAAVAVLGVCSLAPEASADTVYFDDFNDQQNVDRGGPYTQSLHTSVPTIRTALAGGSSSATWLAGVETGGWGQRDFSDSNVATPTSSNFLAFSPDPSRIYKLEASIDTTPLGGADPGGTGSWFTLGFTSSEHNWNGVDANTIAVGQLVRWNSNRVAHLSYVMSGADLAAAGIQYVGWITDRAGVVNLNGAANVKIDNFRLTAGAPNPTLTYDGNGSDGGAVPTDPSSPYAYGNTVTVVGAGTMTRSGFNFAGWNTASDGSGTPYSPAATFVIENNTTLYARWIPVGSSLVTYDGNGSTGGSVPVDLSSPHANGATVTVLGNTGSLFKTSYSFDGWNTAADGAGIPYNPGDTFNITTDTTLYAIWIPGPDYVWSNSAATDNWNTVDPNWNGAAWSNSSSNHAFFTTVGGTVFLDPGIVSGSVNVGTGSFNFPGLNLFDGNLSAASLTVQGFGSNSGVYGSNPTLIVDSTVTVSGDAAVGRANLRISGGTFTADRIISAPVSADWGRLIVSGGTVTATNGVDGSVNTGATFAIDLDGGELRTPSIRVADREIGTGNNAFLAFNGGILTALGGDNADFITTYGGGNNAFVGFGGANIDTNGFNIGILVDLVNAGGGLTKLGAGTLTLGGINTYVGNTTINEGTLVLAEGAQLTFVVDENSASNLVTGAGAAIFNGDFNIDTNAVTGNNGFIWTLVDRASLTGESFDPVTFRVIGFSDADDDGVWTMSDAKGDWSFDESTGELTLDVGNDYDDWGAPYGLTQGSETGDLDGDGLSNQDEYAFGLIPNSGASVNPIVVPLDPSTGTFRYTRRATPANTGLNYTVWTSADLTNWTEDTTASGSQNVIGTATGVETVEVTLSGTPPPTQPRLFIQVRAN